MAVLCVSCAHTYLFDYHFIAVVLQPADQRMTTGVGGASCDTRCRPLFLLLLLLLLLLAFAGVLTACCSSYTMVIHICATLHTHHTNELCSTSQSMLIAQQRAHRVTCRAVWELHKWRVGRTRSCGSAATAAAESALQCASAVSQIS
jgi:hypothetical protein